MTNVKIKIVLRFISKPETHGKIYCFDFGQCTVREENGKLITESEKFISVKEIQGDTLVEVSGLVMNVVISLIIEIL